MKKYYSVKYDREISIPVKTCAHCHNRFDDELEKDVDNGIVDVDTAYNATLCKKCAEM